MASTANQLLGDFESLVGRLRELEPNEQLSVILVIKQVASSLEAQAVAASMTSAEDDKGAAKAAAAANRGGSSSQRRKAARRGAALKRKPGLGDKLDSGELSEEQLDQLAEADRQSGGAAFEDEELIDAVCDADNADLSRQRIRDWQTKQLSREEVEAKYRRQRAGRKIRTYTSEHDGLKYLAAGGDDATIDALRRLIRGASDQLYVADGGRDLAAHQHPRTSEQRDFDAFEALLTAGPLTNPPDPASATGPSGAGHSTTSRTGATDPAPAGPQRHAPPVRAQAIIVFHADQVFGGDYQSASAPMPEMIGHGPIAKQLADRYLEHAEIVSLVLDHHGQPLWLGQNFRHATNAQLKAMIVRDRCCRMCGADYSKCVAHHLVPFNAPARGPTDIDKLALVCDHCHHQLHADNLTLVIDVETGRATTRPATPNETPTRDRPAPRRSRSKVRRGLRSARDHAVSPTTPR